MTELQIFAKYGTDPQNGLAVATETPPGFEVTIRDQITHIEHRFGMLVLLEGGTPIMAIVSYASSAGRG
jgi:hypothetical protein